MTTTRPRHVQLALDAINFEHATRFREPGAFEAFVRLVWSEIEPQRLQWAPYMSVVCDVLHRQMLGEARFRNLLIMLPPGYAKSLLASVLAPAFEWLFIPSRRKLFFSADKGLNIRDSRRCRILIKSPTYQRLLETVCERGGRAKWTFANDQSEKSNFETSAMGFRQCITIDSGTTGKRGDDITIDDPVDVKAVIRGGRDAVQRRLREVNDTYDQVINSRVNNDPDNPSRRTVIMQRLDVNDLVGHLARTDREDVPWFALCLPALYEDDHPFHCELDPRTEPGAVLHPTRDTPESIQRKMDGLGSQALAQMQMRPIPKEGGMIRRAKLVRWEGVPEDAAALMCTELILAVDPASKAADDNDYYAAQLWGRTPDGRMRLLWRRSERMTYPEFVDFMEDIERRWGPTLRVRPSMYLVEETANGVPWIQSVGRLFHGVPVVGFLPSRDFDGPDKSKEARFVHFQFAVDAGMVEVPTPEAVQWPVEVVVDQWCAFPQVDHDDDCDPASMVAHRWMTGKGVPARYTPAEVLGRAARGQTTAKKAARFDDFAN